MDIIVVYRDEEFVVYDTSSYDEFKEVCNYLITSERIWKEWKLNYKYIFPIMSVKYPKKGYLYIPANNTFASNVSDTTLPVLNSLDEFNKTFSNTGKYLMQISYDDIVSGASFVIRHEKLTLSQKTYLIIYDGDHTYIYTVLTSKMNGRLKQYLKNNKDVLLLVQDYIAENILIELR